MTNARRRKLWQARVADYRASELSMREWCERNGVTDHQLRYWLEKTGGRSQGGSWACVELIDDDIAEARKSPTASRGPNGTAPSDAEVAVCVGVARIEVRSGFDPNLLSEVLRVVLVLSKDEGVATC